jgi:UDP-N-acetylglucosamine 4,6-dehydratase/5-epimerase
MPISSFKYPRSYFKKKSILITGGTGTFGQAFVKKILEDDDLDKIIVYSRDEQKQFEMAKIFKEGEYSKLRYFIGDVRDYDRLLLALKDVDIVVHAAAMKHVSISEYNPFECIKTNVIGAQNLIRASIERNVSDVIALSTDKACNPINLYGASKLASDKIFIAANNLSGTKGTKFSVVRYGNVVGSKGSVIPFFQDLIKNNSGYFPITDTRMTRFWISINQGVTFVLSNLSQMQGGEIFVPKIPSMNIVDLAKWMAPDFEVRTVGIRPGEKLHESMINIDDGRLTSEYDDRYVINSNILKISTEGKKISNLVSEGFEYVSNKNTEWLTAVEFRQLINKS